VSIDFEDIENKKVYKNFRGGWIAYQRSKLSNIMFSNALSRRLEGENVACNALHPGFVRTRFAKDNGGYFAALVSIGMTFGAISAEKGAKTQIYLATSSDVEGVTGKYFDLCKPKAPDSRALNESAQERLWAISEDLTQRSR
jgi:NAD(P)-dependent dehydrogenase (short-subunit alcohol dehydrogenase family)